MMIKWERNTLLLLVVVLVVIAGVGYFSFGRWVEPEQVNLTVSEAELASQERIIQVAETDDLVMDIMLTEAAQLQEQLPVEALVDQLIVDLAEIEANNDIVFSQLVKTLDQVSGENQTHYPEQTVQTQYRIEFGAETEEDMNQFLTEITQLTRTIEIAQLDYQEGSDGEINGSTTIIAFHNPNLTTLDRDNQIFETTDTATDE